MRFVGSGHAAIRATHDKTLEFVPGPELTERGTCIVAVGAAVEPLAPLAGPVRITISAGGSSFALDAVANPSWDPAGPAVVRRSASRLPGTFATEADAVASDLPRDLVAALQDPANEVVVDVDVRPDDRPTVVLYLADPATAHDRRLAAELAIADTVLAEDPDSVRLIGRHAARPGGRTLVVATRDLPGRTALTQLAAAQRIETVGLPAVLAVAAASPTRGPLTVSDEADPGRELLRRIPATHRLVLGVAADDLAALLADALDVRGTAGAVIAQHHAPPLRIDAGDSLPPLLGGERVQVCLPAAGSAAEQPLDPDVRAAVVGLLADGVPTKTAAKALATLTGWERRRAYDAVLALRTGRGPSPT